MKIATRNGTFIKQFSGPKASIVCFKFWQAVIASGCPGECSYCFLQTQFPYRSGLYDIKGTIFENLPDIELEARRFLQKKGSLGLIVGENQDGLAFEGPYKKHLGVTPLEILIPLFDRENPYGHSLVILSKFTSTKYAEALGPSENVIFSWSLSLPSISRKYEKKVASLESRLRKAEELRDKGYRIRFRLDALAPIDHWKPELVGMIERINDIQPEMLTLGALRATNKAALSSAAARNGRDSSIFAYVNSKDPSNFKHRTNGDFHLAAFQTVKEKLSPSITLGLCKEDVTMWNSIGLHWAGCHCLNTPSDVVTKPQEDLLSRTVV